MVALQTVAPLMEYAMVDRGLIGALWGICHFGRAWALEKGSMLESNNLISPADAALLGEWLSIVSYAVACLLDDTGVEEAFAFYRYYLADNPDAAPTSV